jgi:hypothetical protein
MLHFDAFANKLLLTVRLKYFSAYVHIGGVVKSSELSSVHEDVKFNFISLFGVINVNRCLERSKCRYIKSGKSRLMIR